MPVADTSLRDDGTVCLRRFRASDLAPYQAYRSDPEISKFQNWQQMSDEQARHFLDHLATVTPLIRAGHWTQIAIADARTDALMGDMGLFLSDDSCDAEIGITLGAAFHRQGHATRAMLLAIDLLFETTPATRLICGADRRNQASLAMIRKLGFVWTHEEPGLTGDIDVMFEMKRP